VCFLCCGCLFCVFGVACRAGVNVGVLGAGNRIPNSNGVIAAAGVCGRMFGVFGVAACAGVNIGVIGAGIRIPSSNGVIAAAGVCICKY